MALDTNVTLQNGSDAITTINLAVAASATGLALAQAVAAAGNLVLSGALVGTVTAGVYNGSPYQAPSGSGLSPTFYAARRMVIVSASAGDNTQTATFTGTDRYNNPITEVVALNGNTAVTTVHDFATVTQIAISALTAGNISAGTSSIASGAWIEIDRFSANQIAIAVLVTVVGGINYTVEETYDDPNANIGGTTASAIVPLSLFPPATVNGVNVGANIPPVPQADATLAALAATKQTTITAPFWAYRLTVNSGTGIAQMQALAAQRQNAR